MRNSNLIENEKVVGAVITFQDISEQKKAEEDIKKYIKEIEHNKNLIQINADELTELNKKLVQSEEKLKDIIGTAIERAWKKKDKSIFLEIETANERQATAGS